MIHSGEQLRSTPMESGTSRIDGHPTEPETVSTKTELETVADQRKSVNRYTSPRGKRIEKFREYLMDAIEQHMKLSRKPLTREFLLAIRMLMELDGFKRVSMVREDSTKKDHPEKKVFKLPKLLEDFRA